MIKCTRQTKYKKIEDIIYENEEEFANSCIPLVKLDNCKPGDYVKSDNGYYLPVIHVRKHNRKTYGYESIMVSIEFPAKYIYSNLYYKNSGKFRQKVFKWSRDERVNEKRTFANARMKLMAFYLSQGMDIYLAFELTYSKYKSKSKLEQMLGFILDNEDFKKHIKETGIMASIQEEMKKQLLNNELIVTELIRIIKDPGANPALKKFALEKSIDLNARTAVNITDSTSNPIKRNINDLIGEKIVGNLNKTGTD